ncbi:hypothetical protein VTH06DRAFT_4720 [Thermothelomyces fergusii]
MARLDGPHRDSDYDHCCCSRCHYHGAAWDTRTFAGDRGGHDGYDTDHYLGAAFGGRPVASVTGYGGDLPFRPRPRSRRPSMTGPGAAVAAAAAAPAPATHVRRTTLRPSLSAGLETESLKQRLTLDRSTDAASAPFFDGRDEHPLGCPRCAQHRHNYHRHHHPRARSLSLSRLSDGLSDSSPEADNGGSEDGDVEGDDDPRNRWDRRLRRIPWRAPSIGASQVRHQPRIPALGEWHGERVRTRPRSEDRELDTELEVGGLRDGYERGFHLFSDDSRHSIHEDDLRLRLGGGERLPNPRVARRRLESVERLGEGFRRKEVSPVARKKANSYREVKPQYNRVHALILTWSFHDLRLEDYTAKPETEYVSLEQETARLRATLERYGYAVHEYLIPMHRSVESLKTKIEQFCARYEADDTLLIIYYHGHGAMGDDNELVFSSHHHPENAAWLKAAAADLYAALFTGGAYATQGRLDNHQDLLKKYERLRPIASVPWSAIRDPILSAACDVLLVLDCCAAGAASLRHLHWQPPPGAEAYTKHLFAACGFESSTSDDMTAAMCEVLDEWAVPLPPPPASASTSTSASASASSSRVPSRSASVDGRAGDAPDDDDDDDDDDSGDGDDDGDSDESGVVGGGAGGGRRSGSRGRRRARGTAAAAAAGERGGAGGVVGGGASRPVGAGRFLTTKRLHQLMEDKLQKRSVGSQPIFKQLLPQDPEQYITLPNLRRRGPGADDARLAERRSRDGRRGLCRRVMRTTGRDFSSAPEQPDGMEYAC